MADLHAVVQRHMEARGMSLRALARAVHHDPSYLSKALRGVKPFGPALARDIDRVLGADGQLRYARQGEGRALLGDPRAALTWLANELRSLGLGLRAGDWASCGTCMVPLEILPGDRVVADYGLFGSIEIGLTGDGERT